MLTTGGFSGYGKGGAAFNSSSPVRGCAAEQRLAVESAVAAARPAMWQPSYSAGPPRITDQFMYSLTLEIEGQRYSVSWREDNTGELPSDLRARSEALWTAKKACS